MARVQPLSLDAEVESRLTCLTLQSPLKVMFTGARVGGDRAVRAEKPFPAIPFIRPNVKHLWPWRTAKYLPAVTVKATRAPSEAARTPVEVSLSMVGYFEITISEEFHNGRGAVSGEGMCSIGLATHTFPLDGKQPGWTGDSYGYHGDDGHKFHGSGLGRAYGPGFGPGDVVGCGLNYHNNSIFFTKNGEFLDTAFVCHFQGQPLYPVVGIDTWNAVLFNFGHAPFTFDLAGYEERAWQEARETEAEGHLRLDALVARILQHNKESPEPDAPPPPEPSESWIQTRSMLLSLVATMHQGGS